MRILAVTPYYVPAGGGLERYAHEMLRRLAAAGHDVHACAVSEAPSTSMDGVHLDLHRTRMRVGNTPIAPIGRHLRRRIDALRPDVVVGHGPVPGPAEAAANAAHDRDVPFVLTYHAGRLHGSSPSLELVAAALRHTTQKRMFQQATRAIAVSRFVRDEALAGHRERTTIIPPGVDTRFYHPGTEVRHDEILFAGPLDRRYRWKGVDVLWDAFVLLRARGMSARLRLVGSGDRHEEFKAKAADRPDVRIDARLPMPQLAKAFREAGVVVLPSRTDAEAFGMVLAEANASGRPVIGSAIGGIPDFVQHGHNGLLVPPGDPHDLADTLESLLSDPQRMDRMGIAGRRRVRSDHDWERLAKKTEAVLTAAC